MSPITMERLLQMDTEREQVVPASLVSKPLAPDNISVTASKRGFRVQWSQVEDVDGYRVVVIDDQDLDEPNLIIERTGDSTLEYFYYVGNIAITRFFAVQSFIEDESSEFTTLTSATTTIDVPNLLNSNFNENSHTGDTNEATLISFAMPGNTIDNNDCIRIRAWGTATSSGNSKTIRLKFGGTTIGTTAGTTSLLDWSINAIVAGKDANDDLQSSNYVMNHTTSTDTEVDFPSEDITGSITILLTAQLTNAGETIFSNGWMIEKLEGDTAEATPPTPPSPPILPDRPGLIARKIGTD